MKRTASHLLKALLALFLLSEIGLRAVGALSFPLYDADDGIGYVPRPNQSGKFLRTHSWVFNDRSMGTPAKWDPAARPNILLIGNSVVMGGNPMDQKDKLGPLLQRDIGFAYSVWPTAAGGWTNVNEMVYLRRNPDVAANPRAFIWEYMTGGLSSLHAWPGEYLFPTKYPLCATWYVFRRYLWPRIHPTTETELPPIGPIQPEFRADFEAMVSALSRASGSPAANIIFLYPKEFEFLEAKAGKEWLPDRADITRIADAAGAEVVDIAKQPEWNETMYRPDAVHPTVQGNAVLAKILSVAFQNSLHRLPAVAGSGG